MRLINVTGMKPKPAAAIHREMKGRWWLAAPAVLFVSASLSLGYFGKMVDLRWIAGTMFAGIGLSIGPYLAGHQRSGLSAGERETLLYQNIVFGSIPFASGLFFINATLRDAGVAPALAHLLWNVPLLLSLAGSAMAFDQANVWKQKSTQLPAPFLVLINGILGISGLIVNWRSMLQGGHFSEVSAIVATGAGIGIFQMMVAFVRQTKRPFFQKGWVKGGVLVSALSLIMLLWHAADFSPARNTSRIPQRSGIFVKSA